MGLLSLANFFYQGTKSGDCQVDTKTRHYIFWLLLSYFSYIKVCFINTYLYLNCRISL